MERKQLPLPTSKELGFALLTISFLIFFGFNFLHLVNEWSRLDMGADVFSKKQIPIIYPVLFHYLLIFLISVFITLTIKGKLKGYGEQGLVRWVVGFSSIGMFLGMTVGIMRLLFGGDPIVFTLLGLIMGTQPGLIVGLILGFKKEFKK
ncbi:MAG: hypothetical protein NUV46_01870 [Nanoarchaeota archaeon]|nr:hypothetical protein [Nanoarchaeota archaeon]